MWLISVFEAKSNSSLEGKRVTQINLNRQLHSLLEFELCRAGAGFSFDLLLLNKIKLMLTKT